MIRTKCEGLGFERRALRMGVPRRSSCTSSGGTYFVPDGHHRSAPVAGARHGLIDDEITRLQTVGRTCVSASSCTEQQRILLEESAFAWARPGVVIEFSRPGGYPNFWRSSTPTATTHSAARHDLDRRSPVTIVLGRSAGLGT